MNAHAILSEIKQEDIQALSLHNSLIQLERVQNAIRTQTIDNHALGLLDHLKGIAYYVELYEKNSFLEFYINEDTFLIYLSRNSINFGRFKATLETYFNTTIEITNNSVFIKLLIK